VTRFGVSICLLALIVTYGATGNAVSATPRTDCFVCVPPPIEVCEGAWDDFDAACQGGCQQNATSCGEGGVDCLNSGDLKIGCGGA